MKIEFKKGRDKSMLVCTREDNSATWMQTDTFYVAHDLAHYAVETNFQFSKGFYGLVKEGMDITDFQDKQKFSPRDMDIESIYVEHLVNLLLSEINDGKVIEDFQRAFNDVCQHFNLPNRFIPVAIIEQVRLELRQLISQWQELTVDEKLTLSFT